MSLNIMVWSRGRLGLWPFKKRILLKPLRTRLSVISATHVMKVSAVKLMVPGKFSQTSE